MVQGLDQLNRRWRAIPRNARINIRAAMENAANDIVEEMWSRAPYDEGDLQASIGWTWGDAPAGTMTIGTVGGRKYGSLRITFYAGGAEAPHAKFVEYGTAPHSLEKNASLQRARAGSALNQKRQQSSKRHPGAAAKPFFWPVWRAYRKRVRARIRTALRKAIRES